MANDPQVYININDTLLPVIDAGLIPGGSINIEDSPTYRWNGATMLQRIGEVLPIVYGRHVVAPTLINAFIEEGEYETLNMLLAWCEGEVESITNIKVAGTQIENLYIGATPNSAYNEGAEVSVRTGANNQAPVQHFDELHNITVVEEFLYSGNEPYIYNGTITDAQAFRLEFAMDKLYQKDEQGNDISWYVAIQVEIKKKGEGAFRTLGIVEINKKTASEFTRYFKTEYVPKGQYILRIKKVSENAQVGANAKTFGVVRLVTVDEVRSENLQYPTTALTGLRLISFQDLQGTVPNITGMVTGKKVRVPKITSGGYVYPQIWEDYYYDAVTGEYKLLAGGTLDPWLGNYETIFSANPVWCLRDLLTSKRYGLGEFISEDMIDEDSFIAGAQYCEEAVLNDEGQKEKRCMLDIVIDTASPAPDVLATILRTFRGVLFQSEGKLRLVIEKAEDQKALFNMGNICAESFSMQYLPKKNPNVLSIQYANKDKNYLRDSVEVGTSEQQIRDVPAEVQSLDMMGVTRLTQVLRDGRVYLNKLKNNNRVISFSAFFDAVLLQPFDVFEFQHDVPAWGSGGRLREFCTNSCLKLDGDVFLEPGLTYKIKIRNPDTDIIETRSVSDIAGVYSSLNVSVPFSFLPQENDLWTLDADGVSGTQNYRITSVQKSEAGRITITAIENNNDVYDPSAVVIPQEIYTHLTLDIPKVQNLTLSELTNKLPNGTFESRIQVSWKLPPKSAKYVKQATKYEIWLSDNEGASWQLIGQTDREYYTIPESVSTGLLYTVAVVSVTEAGEKNPLATSPQQNIVIQGAVIPPAQVTNFQFSFTDEIMLTWDKNPENDIQAYEIRTQDVGWGSNSGGFVWRGQANRFIVVRQTQREGIVYYIRAINTSDQISSVSATVEPKNLRPASPLLLATTLFEKTFLTWFPLSDADLQYYEVWQNDEPVFFGVDGQQNEFLVAQELGTSFVANITYPTTYFRICGVDRFGRGTFSNIIVANQIQIGTGSIAPNSITATKITDDAIETRHLNAGVVTAGKIAAKAVVADNIDVGNLSAISADLGTIRSGEIIGALIKTSDDVHRVEMDNAGLRAYDVNGLLTVDLTQGQIKFLNPVDPNYYSYLDAGGLVLHTPYENIPYATRIKSGTASAGDRVRLERWKSKPDITLSMKRLRSYDASFSESNQEWCMYADNLSFYDFGGANFGWQFDVRAKLVKSGGTRSELNFDVGFNTLQCTGTGVCQVQIGMCFQIWCNQASPALINYGKLCYKVNYRKVGDSLFCSRDFEYQQPSDTVALIKNTNKVCHTIDFGTSGQWEVCVSESGRNYIESQFQSGGYVCFYCNIETVIDKSYFASKQFSAGFSAGISVKASGFNTTNAGRCCLFMLFQDFNQADAYVQSSQISYVASTEITVRRHFASTVSSASVSLASGAGGVGYTVPSDNDPFSIIGRRNTINKTLSATGSYRSSVFEFDLRASVRSGYSYTAYDEATVAISGTAIQTVCFKCCVRDVVVTRQLCCLFVGSADQRDIKLFSSMRDTVGAEEVLDPSGEINYLAIAYR